VKSIVILRRGPRFVGAALLVVAWFAGAAAPARAVPVTDFTYTPSPTEIDGSGNWLSPVFSFGDTLTLPTGGVQSLSFTFTGRRLRITPQTLSVGIVPQNTVFSLSAQTVGGIWTFTDVSGNLLHNGSPIAISNTPVAVVTFQLVDHGESVTFGGVRLDFTNATAGDLRFDGIALGLRGGASVVDAVPEPTTFALLGVGAAGLALSRRRTRRPRT
jgi:hypothetical protein